MKFYSKETCINLSVWFSILILSYSFNIMIRLPMHVWCDCGLKVAPADEKLKATG